MLRGVRTTLPSSGPRHFPGCRLVRRAPVTLDSVSTGRRRYQRQSGGSRRVVEDRSFEDVTARPGSATSITWRLRHPHAAVVALYQALAFACPWYPGIRQAPCSHLLWDLTTSAQVACDGLAAVRLIGHESPSRVRAANYTTRHRFGRSLNLRYRGGGVKLAPVDTMLPLCKRGFSVIKPHGVVQGPLLRVSGCDHAVRTVGRATSSLAGWVR